MHERARCEPVTAGDSRQVPATRPARPARRAAIGVQRKLVVGRTNDPLEREADRAADQVLAVLAGRGEGAGGTLGPTPTTRVRRRSAAPATAVGPDGGEIDHDIERRITGACGGEHLDASTRTAMEGAFGYDFGGVRIHRDSEVATQLSASAFTLGADVHVAPGQFAPHTRSGRWLLGHELAHVVQQGGGAPTSADGRVRRGTSAPPAGDAHRHDSTATRIQRATLSPTVSPPVLRTMPVVGPAVIQRTPSQYKKTAVILTMSLREFDAHATAQVDWALTTADLKLRERLRSLLILARANGSNLISGCGEFVVSDLLAVETRYQDLGVYARAANPRTSGAGIVVEDPAPTPAIAVQWGAAIAVLEKRMSPKIAAFLVPQRSVAPCLRDLVANDAVTDFIAYVMRKPDQFPSISANDGSDTMAYVVFHQEGGKGPALEQFRSELPEIRNFHRFTMPQLKILSENKNAWAANLGSSTPLPVSVVLQTSFDAGGGYKRDAKLTAAIKRTSHLTLVVEGRATLGESAEWLHKLAKGAPGGKLDEVMISGHGGSRHIELAGTPQTKAHLVTIDPESSRREHEASAVFVAQIADVLRNDPRSRIVLNACLTASNSVDTVLSADADEAAKQVGMAIAAKPSLALWIRNQLADRQHAAEVRGANASFGDEVGLVDTQGRLDIVAADKDPALTATNKLEYVEFGTEPVGMLRATLECWARDEAATMAALKRRLAQPVDTAWGPVVIRAMCRVILSQPRSGRLIQELEGAARSIYGLRKLNKCKVSLLRSAVPAPFADSIYRQIVATEGQVRPAVAHARLVLLQAWVDAVPDRAPLLVSFLDGPVPPTRTAIPYLDPDVLERHVRRLLAGSADPNSRSRLLIAAYLLTRRGSPGQGDPATRYILDLVGTKEAKFPETRAVATALEGTTPNDVLAIVGLAKAEKLTVPVNVSVKPPQLPNLSPEAGKVNTVRVEPDHRKVMTYGDFGFLSNTEAFTLPAGNKVGSIEPKTVLQVIGTTTAAVDGGKPERLYAIEFRMGAYYTVFVRVKDVRAV